MVTESKENYFRVPITMPAEMVEYLDGLGMESKKTGGHKIPNTMIVRCAIRLVGRLKPDVTNVRSEEELQERLLDACRNFKK